MSYSVIWNMNNGADRAGTLDVARRQVELREMDGNHEVQVAVRYSDLDSMFVEQSAPARNAWEPSLVLVTRGGDRIAIGLPERPGALQELAELVAHGRGRIAA